VAAVVLLIRLLLAATFFCAALPKIGNQSAFKKGLLGFGVPKVLIAPMGLWIPLVELLVAVLLIPSITAWWASVVALVMLGAFTAVVAVNLFRGNRPACNCFGHRGASPIGPSTVVRNLFFFLCAGLILVQGAYGEQPGLADYTYSYLGDRDWVIICLGTSLLLAIPGAAWMIFQLLQQQGRIMLRIDNLELRLEAAGVPKPIMQGNQVTQGLPTGSLAPAFSLPELGGSLVSLSDLLSLGRPIVLFFMDPACGPCEAMLPEIAAWQVEHGHLLTIGILTRGSAESQKRKLETYNIRTVLLQVSREVAERYHALATPSAVLIDFDGLIAAPLAMGSGEISTLILFAVDYAISGRGRRKFRLISTSALG
jgi:hypothetical protein